MSTNANVLRSLRSRKWLRHTLRARRRRATRGTLQQFAARQRHEAVEHARRAWAPRTGSFSFGDTPPERRPRRFERRLPSARASRVGTAGRHLALRTARGRRLPSAAARRLPAPRGRLSLQSARARFSLTCACGAILGYGLFTLLLR
jgi:hypothetical protein